MSVRGWVILDIVTGRRHVPRVWGSEAEAVRERAELLRDHRPGSQWWGRLAVRPATEAKKGTP